MTFLLRIINHNTYSFRTAKFASTSYRLSCTYTQVNMYYNHNNRLILNVYILNENNNNISVPYLLMYILFQSTKIFRVISVRKYRIQVIINTTN